MWCPECRIERPPGQRFCPECGTRLAAPGASQEPAPREPVSGAPRRADARYADPGSYTPKHLAEKILTSAGAMQGERKQVTVLFSDVSGFTAISEGLDPEEVHAIMDRAFAVILDTVHRHEGTVNQFLGDGVMALFGAPVAHEDHVHRALCAALAIQEGLGPLREEVRRAHGVEFQMRMGLNTGLVVVGAIGRDLRMDYTAVGDTTNLAARLLALAKPGQIVVSRRIQHLRDGFFVFEDLGEFQLKGKTDPVRAYALREEIRGRTRFLVSRERGLTPLAGRREESRRLDATWARAREGKGAILLVTGEPGVGKSRLIHEFLLGLEGAPVPLASACLSYGQAIPYYPVLEWLHQLLSLLPGMGDAEKRRRIADWLGAVELDGGEAADLLAHFLGLPTERVSRLPQTSLKDRTLQLLRAVFLAASRVAPRVLVVEDLHWADASSAEFLDLLCAAVPGHRILLLLSSRPGDRPLQLPGAEVVALGGLDPDSARQVALAVLGAREAEPVFLEMLLTRSEGNPLYVEEIVRQLLETGGLAVEGGQVRLRSADIRVPATIHDIISARVDRLPEPLKHTLQGAAVIGRRFTLSLLTGIPGMDAAPGRHLDELERADFIFSVTREPEAEYSFKHALTQDVVYAGLLERRRRQYHGAVGVRLEALFAGRVHEAVELLAHHFERSGEAEKAVDYSILAAEKAQRRWANQEALALFEIAQRRIESMPDSAANRLRRIDTVIKQGEVKFALGRHAEHIQALEGIREAVEAAADPPRRAAWFYWAGFLHSLTGGHPDVPIAHCQQATRIAEAAGLDELGAFAQCCLAHVHVVAGNLRDAVDAGGRALPVFEQRGNLWWACRTLWGLSMAHNAIGQWQQSLDCCARAREYGRVLNDLRLKVVGLWRTGSTHIQRGDPETGLRYCDEALALSPIPFDAAMIRAVRALGLVKAGELAQGIAAMEEAIAWFEQSGLRYTRSLFVLLLAEGWLLRGAREKAAALAEGILRTSREMGYRHLEGVALRLLGEAAGTVDPARASALLVAAERLLEAVGARNEVARTLSAQGALQHRRGDESEARRLLEQALDIFVSLGTLDGPGPVREALAEIAGHPHA